MPLFNEDGSSISSPFKSIEPSTSSVPSGIVSFTFTVVGAVPFVLSSVMVYVMISPSLTSFPFAGDADFPNLTSALFIIVSTELVSFPSTVALFWNLLVTSEPGKVFTVTSKLKLISPVAGTFTLIPLIKFDRLFELGAPFIFILSGTRVVSAGMLSCIITSFAWCPAFVTFIVYVIFSPSTT